METVRFLDIGSVMVRLSMVPLVLGVVQGVVLGVACNPSSSTSTAVQCHAKPCSLPILLSVKVEKWPPQVYD